MSRQLWEQHGGRRGRHLTYMRDGHGFFVDLSGPEYTLAEGRETVRDAFNALMEDPEWAYAADFYSFEIKLYMRDGNEPELIERYGVAVTEDNQGQPSAALYLDWPRNTPGGVN